MAKVLTFSRVFPSYHPKAGEPTYFVEKIWKSFHDNGLPDSFHTFVDEYLCQYGPYAHTYAGKNFFEHRDFVNSLTPKHHTIRAGHRWKAGDMFSPRIWSGKPYNSKQIQFAPDIQVKKVWRFEIKNSEIRIWGSKRSSCGLYDVPANEVPFIAEADGLSFIDFMRWFKFPKDFDGQIICWSDSISY